MCRVPDRAQHSQHIVARHVRKALVAQLCGMFRERAFPLRSLLSAAELLYLTRQEYVIGVMAERNCVDFGPLPLALLFCCEFSPSAIAARASAAALRAEARLTAGNGPSPISRCFCPRNL